MIDEKTGEIQRFRFDHRRREFVPELQPDEVRLARFALQDAARRLLPDHRVLHCVRTLTNKDGFVGIVKDVKTSKAHYSGLQTCGSPWSCPICSAKISERRKLEVRQAVDTHLEAGGGVEMVTLTVRHSRCDVLAELMGKIRKALAKLREHRDYKQLRQLLDVVGSIRALEVTHGDANGWHPHFHELWLFPAPLTVRQRSMLQRLLFDAWSSASVRAGLPAPTRQRGVHIQPADSAAEYVSKWGTEPRWEAASELTKANSKRGSAKGRTPFDLLRAYAEGDSRAGALFAEFAKAFKGYQQLRWSPGLKQAFGIGELSDAEIASEQTEQAERVTQITRDQWRAVLRQPYQARAVLLRLAETGGHEAVVRYVFGLLSEPSTA
ncbi:hypothetical protein E0E52_14515 [Azotobacter chroococcum]|uniref:protein rep n=1 Tax=Azotobacter chroococcum TaxID=353 RepID=UPI00103F33F7|nr:protein rep [Azotobacter chroococcum]TBW03700.1 hypothetical protein E0E52_14515 [Azotobacter chroococcum]